MNQMTKWLLNLKFGKYQIIVVLGIFVSRTNFHGNIMLEVISKSYIIYSGNDISEARELIPCPHF